MIEIQSEKYLISIGIMDGKGFKCNTENGVMKIHKGFAMVMKGIKRGYNLSLVAGLAPLFLVFGQTRVCLVL